MNSQTQEDDTCILEIAQFTTESVKVHLDYAFSSEREKREDSMGERYKNICNNNMASMHGSKLHNLLLLLLLLPLLLLHQLLQLLLLLLLTVGA